MSYLPAIMTEAGVFFDATLRDPIAAFTFMLALSTILLWRATVRLAREASESAIDQGEKMERSIFAATQTAQAATEQVKIAKDTAYRELRAYISIEVDGQPANSQILSGNIIVKNAGQTPAQIRVFSAAWIGPWPTDRPVAVGPEPQEDVHHQPYVNRGASVILSWFYPEDGTAEDEINSVMSGIERAVMVYGRVEFTDFLRRERVLHFSYRNTARLRDGEPFEMVPTPEGNDYEDRGASK